MDAMKRKTLDDLREKVTAHANTLRAFGDPGADELAEVIEGLWNLADTYIHAFDAESRVVRFRDKEIELAREENRDLRKRALRAEEALLQERANLERMREIAVRYREKLGEKA